jgi:hypothetical protein
VAKIIPNQNSWIGFTLTAPAAYTASAAVAGTAVSVTETELDAATNLTALTVSLQASSQGNAIPTPALDSLFDRSIIGTVQGQFQGDFYRDSVQTSDVAWTNLARGVSGYFLVSRFGGTGTNKIPRSGNNVEIWPVGITARTASQMTSNTVQTFTCMGALLDPPAENGVVVASSSTVSSAPLNVVATAGTTGTAIVDWDIPLVPNGTITSYKVYKSTVAGGAGAYTEVTTNITKLGTTASLTSLTAGLTYFKVAAVTANGDGTQSAFSSVTIL